MKYLIGVLVIIAAVLGVIYLAGRRYRRRLFAPGGHKRDPSMFVFAFFSKVKQRIKQVGFEGLTEAEKICWSVTWLWRLVQMAGFEIYYQEPYGGQACEAEKGFEAIGAKGFADIVHRANSVFEGGRPAKAQELRVEQLERAGGSGRSALRELDEEFRGCEDDYDELMADFIASHREDFSQG